MTKFNKTFASYFGGDWFPKDHIGKAIGESRRPDVFIVFVLSHAAANCSDCC